MGCQTLNYQKTVSLFQSLLCSLCSCPIKRRCCLSHPWLCAPLLLVSALCRDNICKRRWWEAGQAFWWKAPKQHSMWWRHSLFSFLNRGFQLVSPSEGVQAQGKGAFPCKDRAITAGEPCVFAQTGSHGGSWGHPDLPWAAHEWKEEAGVRRKWLGHAVKTTKEAAGSSHSLLLCWPQTISLGCFTSGSSGADPQPGRTHTPSDSAMIRRFPSLPSTRGRIPGHGEPTVWQGSRVRQESGEATFRDLAIRNDTYTHFRGP